MSQWSEILPELLSLIITNLTTPSDLIRCSAVCTSWRSVALRHRCTFPHSVPGLMFSPKLNTRSLKRKFIVFSHLYTPSYHNFDDDCNDLYVSKTHSCCGSYRGWLVLTVEDRNNVYLLNPFSRGCLLLPKINKKVYKAVLSSSPSLDRSNCVVLALFYARGAAFYRLGGESWTSLIFHGGLSDGLFHEGRFYVIDDYGKVFSINLDDYLLVEIESQPSNISEIIRNKWYLVELKGELCIVQRKFKSSEMFYYEYVNAENDEEYGNSEKKNKGCSWVSTRKFRVWRMDSGTREWAEVSDLGGHALFLGCNNSFSLDEIMVEGIKGNKVYFTDDRQLFKHFGMDDPGRDMGVYDMRDSGIQSRCSGLYGSDPFREWLMDSPPAVWVTPLPW